MDNVVEQRIRQVYPKGVLWERDDSMLGADNQDARIDQALGRVTELAPVRIGREPWKKPSYQFHITHRGDPLFEDWVWAMDNAEKIGWIRRHQRPYVVLWLKVSRVADYYYHFYNHWTPRGATGYLDADFTVEPNEVWRRYEKVVTSHLESQGFSYASSEMLKERTPFLLEQGFDEIPEDDPRWDDDDFEPPLVPSSLYECLFGE